MLVLNRQPGTAILIDGDIRIVVLACDKRGVRIGIEAPISVTIMREEIAHQMAESNRMATNPDAVNAWLGGGASAHAATAPASGD
jgi:carbon storage regulator